MKPDKAYISVPTRPPAEAFVCSPEEHKINKAYQLFIADELNAELITGYEGNEFSATGDLSEDVLNITAVHPMRKDAVDKLVQINKGDRLIFSLKDIPQRLYLSFDEDKLIDIDYSPHRNQKSN